MSQVLLGQSVEVPAARLPAIRQLLDEAFAGRFDDNDWAHGLGGTHAIIADGERVLAHGSVVERIITVGMRDLRVGYVEGLAVAPYRQRMGLGAAVVTALNEVIFEQFELGMLSTSEWHFYEGLGWTRWRGPTWVVDANGDRERTADEDDGIMVYRTRHSSELDDSLPLTCQRCAGDSW